MKRLKKPTSLRKILQKYDVKPSKYLTKEYQVYGLKLAAELDDWEHRGLYIRLAKEVDREVLETARFFVRDAENVKNKARLFMWKLKELREARGKSNKANKR